MIRVAGAGAAAAGLLLAGTPVASAHDTSIDVIRCGYQWQARCGYGGVTDNHTRVYSCDTFSDGIGVRTEYLLRNGGSGYVDDANGSASGCSAIFPGTSSNPITDFRVCQKSNVWYCVGWRPA
ncbi:hypothetical protein [Actinokineospora iranica]|uniref:hypothetical protein n=1 Tax=Actinokineospora iranica TaxID=1271860 RepID=UPI000B838390|nr:hypothetical protein [Actinokineospora iranica]